MMLQKNSWSAFLKRYQYRDLYQDNGTLSLVVYSKLRCATRDLTLVVVYLCLHSTMGYGDFENFHPHSTLVADTIWLTSFFQTVFLLFTITLFNYIWLTSSMSCDVRQWFKKCFKKVTHFYLCKMMFCFINLQAAARFLSPVFR